MERAQRKMEHIRHAMRVNEQVAGNHFDLVRLLPNSLPNICYDNSNLSTRFGPFALSSPIVINAMTGGAEVTKRINQKLAILARERGLAMAVGSQMAAVKDASVRESYSIARQEHPEGIIFANIGAEATVDQAAAAVEMIRADGLQIHLNVMQELLMPEGDRDFHGYLENIQMIQSKLGVPVVVKEVGFGMTAQTVQRLFEAGVTLIDLGGSGGTNFATIENMRSRQPLTAFEQWGLSTAESLLEAAACEPRERGISLMATGGVRHGLDVAKALVLGADAVGMAGAMLALVQNHTTEEALAVIDRWHHEIRVAMTALGVTGPDELRRVPVLLLGELGEFARLRGIEPQRYAQRG